jgi:hypothetical protein
MPKDNKYLSFRENKKNAGLITQLKELADINGRRLNDYLNIILSDHVKQKQKTNN